MASYTKMSESKFKLMANEPTISIQDIMQWYKQADSTQERVDMIRLMKERAKQCIIQNRVW